MKKTVQVAMVGLAIWLPTVTTAQQTRPVTVPQQYRNAPAPGTGDKISRGRSKLSTSLREIASAFEAVGRDWRNVVNQGGLILRRPSDIRIELRFDAGGRSAIRNLLRSIEATITSENAPGLLEAYVPVARLVDLVGHPRVYKARTARGVIPLEGASTTQGVAASNANLAHMAGVDGSGVTIAVIDVFKDSLIVPLQTSGDWPPPARIDTFDSDGGGFGSTGIPHGNAALEVAYDMAPGATFLAYETQTVGDWYASIINAVTAGADVISVSLGTTLDGIGDGTAAPGSIAEAAAIAKGSGVLVVNAAGNESLDHWGGPYYNSSVVNNTHDWDGPGDVGNLNIHPFCQPVGTLVGGDLSWDDWTDVLHDYDLFLFEFDGTSWVQRAVSDDFQSGFPGDTPTESILYQVDEAFFDLLCGDMGLFGWMIQRFNAPTDRNFQFFASTFLGTPIPERSLLFPADSPDVLSVAAVDVTNLDQEFYSSEGPILAPGGGIPADSTLGFKPDLSAFANVDTETYGPSLFNGTSAATPHVAGLAALMLARDTSMSVDALMTAMRENAAANDLGPIGFDPNYGHGKATWIGDTLKFAGTVFLEGPYSGGSMATSSVFADSLPLQQPYSDAAFDGTYLDYDTALVVASIPPGAVDWVLVGLRNSPSGPIFARKAGFVLDDGSIVSPLGDTLIFEDVVADSFYVVVDHRNHHSIMSSSRVGFQTSVGVWDFTTSMSNAFTSGGPPMKDLKDGNFGMFASNGAVDRVTTANDFNLWLQETKQAKTGYAQADYDLDGQVTVTGFNLWLANTKAVAASQVP